MEKPKSISTKITQLFNMEYPIMGAPMFLVSNESMVMAACRAGGMGSFPAFNYRPIEKYKETILSLKKQIPDKPFAINIIVQKSNKYQDEQIDIAIENKVDLLITSLGNPQKVIDRAKGTSTKVFCDVIGLKHAKKVAEQGADGLVVVGSGAGGHGGDISLFALLPYLKKHIDLPMFAAGSMNDGKSMMAALALGADGIYMGTRIIASKEAQVGDEYKKAIIEAGCEDIVNTDRVDGFPGNFILTKNLEEVLKPNFVDNVLSQNKRVKRAISLMRASRSLFGSQERKLSYKNTFSAGQGVGGIESVEDIQTIFWKAATEYHQLKSQLP